MNGLQFLVLVASIFGAATMIPLAMRHDRLLAEIEATDYESLDADADQRYTDDCDSFRKGES